MTITQGERYYATASRNAGVRIISRGGYVSWKRYMGKVCVKRAEKKIEGKERVREEITSWDYETIGATPMIRSLGMG